MNGRPLQDDVFEAMICDRNLDPEARAHLQADVHRPDAKVAFIKHYGRKTALTAADLLNHCVVARRWS